MSVCVILEGRRGGRAEERKKEKKLGKKGKGKEEGVETNKPEGQMPKT